MIKELFEIAGERKKDLIKGTILKVIESSFAGAPLIFLYLTLNELFSASINIRTVILLVIGLAACFFLQAIFYYWADAVNYPTGIRILSDLRIRLGEHIRKLSMGFYSERETGDLNNIINQDIKNIEIIPTFIYPQLVTAIALPVFIAVFLLFIDWRMALATLSVIPVALVILKTSRTVFKRLAKQRAKAAAEANSRIIEYTQGIGVIKAFGQIGSRFKKFETAMADYKKTNVDLVVKLVPPDVAFSAILGLGLGFILLVGSYLFLGGELSLEIFLLFLVLGLQIYVPIQNLFVYMAMMRVMDASMERVIEVLNRKPLPEPDDDPELNRFDIEFKNVSFKYEDTDVLTDVNFTVPQNTITALVGPSGAGKTTVANLIARFWDVDSGEILIGGCNIKDLKTDRLLSYISMVFQDVYLFNDSIINNIKFGNKDAAKEEVIAAANAAQCHEFIEKLPHGYDTVVGEGGATLSGGEKQRIAIARAILKDTPIVILDEATAYVDPENEILIQKAINCLVESKTLIIIAHRLSTITSANQILVIDGGKVIEHGMHSELVSREGLYKRFWEKRQKARGWKITKEQQ
nr:putative Lipid A export ATP-binding/permease protein [uncultured archaeon]